MCLRCWYVSGRISRMKGGEFLKFIFGCWHSLTTWKYEISNCLRNFIEFSYPKIVKCCVQLLICQLPYPCISKFFLWFFGLSLTDVLFHQEQQMLHEALKTVDQEDGPPFRLRLINSLLKKRTVFWLVVAYRIFQF